VRAVQLHAVGEDPRLHHVPPPDPGPGEVRVAVRACGICGSDLHVIDGAIRVPELPLTLGHEPAGVVDAVGAGVDLAIGAPVLVNPILSCHDCTACRAGRTNLCPRHRVIGVAAPGAAADYVLVPVGNLHVLPPGVDFAEAAVLADAVAGPFRAIRSSGVAAGDVVAVYGLGGLGLSAALLLDQVVGARVIGVDVRESALARAAALGLTSLVQAGPGRPSDVVQEMTDGGADASFEFVGRLDTTEQALRSLRPGGTCVVMGVTPARLSLGIHHDTLVAREWTLRGSYGYTDADLADLLALVGEGRVDLEGVVSHTFPLEDYAEGLAALRDPAGDVSRVVITVGD
jgi:propanol-preferring alcohol dehydrogenase